MALLIVPDLIFSHTTVSPTLMYSLSGLKPSAVILTLWTVISSSFTYATVLPVRLPEALSSSFCSCSAIGSIIVSAGSASWPALSNEAVSFSQPVTEKRAIKRAIKIALKIKDLTVILAANFVIHQELWSSYKNFFLLYLPFT